MRRTSIAAALIVLAATGCGSSGSGSGSGSSGSSGTVTPGTSSGSPTYAQLAVGAAGGCVITRADATVRCFDGEAVTVPTGMEPTKASAVVPRAKGATAIAIGSDRACAILPGGKLLCWTLKKGFATATPDFEEIPLSNVTAIAMGRAHACAIAGGAIQCWGSNDTGQIGDGTRQTRATPVALALSGAATIALRESSSCVVLASGKVSCWGSGFKDTPQEVAGLDDVATISLGESIVPYLCALHKDGHVTCIGSPASIEPICSQNQRACNADREEPICKPSMDCPPSVDPAKEPTIEHVMVLPTARPRAQRVQIGRGTIAVSVGSAIDPQAAQLGLNAFFFPMGLLHRCGQETLEQAFDIALTEEFSCVLGYQPDGAERLMCPGLGFTQSGNTTGLCGSLLVTLGP